MQPIKTTKRAAILPYFCCILRLPHNLNAALLWHQLYSFCTLFFNRGCYTISSFPYYVLVCFHIIFGVIVNFDVIFPCIKGRLKVKYELFYDLGFFMAKKYIPRNEPVYTHSLLFICPFQSIFLIIFLRFRRQVFLKQLNWLLFIFNLPIGNHQLHLSLSQTWKKKSYLGDILN